jgi:hypothetical protein
VPEDWREETGINRKHRQIVLAMLGATLITGCGGSSSPGKPITHAVVIAPSVAQSSPATTRCSRDDVQRPLTSERPGADAQMVPPGAVSLTICGYNGGNLIGGTPQNALFKRGQVRTLTTVRHMAEAINAVKRSAADALRMACTSDVGDKLIAYFHYRAGVDDIVTLDLGGCGILSNGHIARMGDVAARLARRTRSVTLVWPKVAGRCLSVCRGATTRHEALDAYLGPTLMSVTGISWRGRFRVPLAASGNYRLEIVPGNKSKPVAVGYAQLRIGHTTTVVVRPVGSTG